MIAAVKLQIKTSSFSFERTFKIIYKNLLQIFYILLDSWILKYFDWNYNEVSAIFLIFFINNDCFKVE
jgi:hypothetical protein